MPEHLQPLSLGEILDRTSQLYRRNFWLFAGVAAVPTAAIVAAGLAAVALLAPLALVMRHGSQTAIVADAIVAVLALAAAAACSLAFVLSQAAITRAAIQVYQGRKIKVREALAGVRPRLGRYLWLMVLQALLAAGIPAACAAAILGPMVFFGSRIDGNSTAGFAMGLLAIGIALAAIGVCILLVLDFAMAMAASVAEDKPAWASIRRATKLSSGSRGRILVMFLVVWALTMALSMIGYIPMVIVAAIVGATANAGLAATAVLVFTEVLNVVVSFSLQTLVAPAYLIALVLFYYDQRIRREGYDIEWMMQQAGLESPEKFAGLSLAEQPSMPLPDPATVKEL